MVIMDRGTREWGLSISSTSTMLSTLFLPLLLLLLLLLLSPFISL